MNLNTTIDLDIKGFFQWWGRELAFLLPASLRRALRNHHGELIFTPTDSGFNLVWQGEDALQPGLHKQLESSDPAAYRQLQEQLPGLAKAEYILRLPAEQSLQKILFLPAAAQENLEQVVGFELDRYTPFKPEQVYFNTITLGKTEFGQLRVLLVLVPKAPLDQSLQSLEAWAVRPHRVDCAPVPGEEFLNVSYNLLPDRYRSRGSVLDQSVHWLLSLGLLVLTTVVLVWPVWQESDAVDQLKSRLKSLEKQTQLVESQQQEIDAVRAETQKLLDAKQQAPALLAVLDELSRLLNDDTWLTHLQYADKHMQIQGQSPAASALIGLLEASDYFNNVSFVSPLTQDKVTGRERFQISLDVVMPAPEEDTPTEEETTEEADPAASDAEESTDNLDEGSPDEAVSGDGAVE